MIIFSLFLLNRSRITRQVMIYKLIIDIGILSKLRKKALTVFLLTRLRNILGMHIVRWHYNCIKWLSKESSLMGCCRLCLWSYSTSHFINDLVANIDGRLPISTYDMEVGWEAKTPGDTVRIPKDLDWIIENRIKEVAFHRKSHKNTQIFSSLLSNY